MAVVVAVGAGAGGGLGVEPLTAPALPATPPLTVGLLATGVGVTGTALGAEICVGVLTAPRDGHDDVRLGPGWVGVVTDGVELCVVAAVEVRGVTVATWPVLLGGAADAPTVMRTAAAASAAPPVALLPNMAHPTLPRARAITAMTSANIPKDIAAPLTPKASPPTRTPRASPPHPDKSARPNF